MLKLLLPPALQELFGAYRYNATFSTHRQLAKFIIVGAISTTLDIAMYYLLTRYTLLFSANLLVAKAISYGVGSINSFILNRRWTFRKNGTVQAREIVRFYVAVGLALLINNFSLYVLLKLFYPYDLIAAVLAAGITFLWNFIAAKFWVFIMRSEKSP